MPQRKANLLHAEEKVAALIDHDIKKWNMALVSSTFSVMLLNSVWDLIELEESGYVILGNMSPFMIIKYTMHLACI